MKSAIVHITALLLAVALVAATEVVDLAEDNTCQTIEALRAQAAKGDVKSQGLLGRAYFEGNGVVKDYDNALFWLRKAAEQDDVAAQTCLGMVYFNGAGVDRDYVVAARLWIKAAEKGDVRARSYLAACYNLGRGLPTSKIKAANLRLEIRKESKENEVLVDDAFWSMTLHVPLGFPGIAERVRALAESGDRDAQYTLASLYSSGRFVSQSYEESLRWLRKSAEQGKSQAQGLLSFSYLKGRGAPVDRVEAYKWALLARDQSLIGMDNQVNELEQELTPAEQAEGQQRAKDAFRLIKNGK